MTLKKRMVKVLVWPVVLYGCETWTLLQDEINRLEAFGCVVVETIGKYNLKR